MFDKADTIVKVCNALSQGASTDAADILAKHYSFVPAASIERKFSVSQQLDVFCRDGFVDQYSGARLVFPGVLRLISRVLPIHFPFHKNWKMDSCHIAYYELFPTIDHVIPVARGGTNRDSNLVTTSMVRNSAKASFSLDDLGWKLMPRSQQSGWDGLMFWFVRYVQQNEILLKSDAYLGRWFRAAKAAVP